LTTTVTTKRTQEDDEGDDGEGDEGDEVKEHMSMCRHRAERRPDRHGKFTTTRAATILTTSTTTK